MPPTGTSTAKPWPWGNSLYKFLNKKGILSQAAIVVETDTATKASGLMDALPMARLLAFRGAEQTLDAFSARLALHHINFLRSGEDNGLLEGASGLLGHSRIDFIELARCDSRTALQLTEHNYAAAKIEGGQMVFVREWPVGETGPCLAVQERLMGTLSGTPRAMPDPVALCRHFGVFPRGIIHLGAHEGREANGYLAQGIKRVVMVEANPEVFERLSANIEGLSGVIAVNKAICAQAGPVLLRRATDRQASSLLAMKAHQSIHPEITEVDRLTVEGITLDGLAEELALDLGHFNLLNMDIQGAELLALQGGQKVLVAMEAVYLEVNFDEPYENCAQIKDIDDFLAPLSFKRVATFSPYHLSWGDGLYLRLNGAS